MWQQDVGNWRLDFRSAVIFMPSILAWSLSGSFEAVVFHNKIWIYSGKHTGFDDNWSGDVWQMTTSEVTSR